MNFLIISDNKFLIERFHQLLVEKSLYSKHTWKFVCSKINKALLNDSSLPVSLESVEVKSDYVALIGKYDVIFSLHCKQLFPTELVQKVKCINVHPGYNPYNRGWFPQVFSILNKEKAGATIHEIDALLDHGPIIARKEVTIESWDTSLSAYNKVQEVEMELLADNLEKIISGNYQTILPEVEGNVNLKKDFNALCEIDLSKQVSMAEAIDHLRALTHGDYMNGYYIDAVTGKKVFVSVVLKPEL